MKKKMQIPKPNGFDGEAYMETLMGKTPPGLGGIEAHILNCARELVISIGNRRGEIDRMGSQIQAFKIRLEEAVAGLRKMEGEFGGYADVLCFAEAERQGCKIPEPKKPNNDEVITNKQTAIAKK